jgi:hypothetical protein
MSSSKEASTTPTKTASAPSRSIQHFDGNDYTVWAAHMSDILRERQLLKYLDDKEKINNYIENEDMQALSEIRFTLANPQMRMIISCRTAHDAWAKLKRKYQHSSESDKIFLRNQFLSMKAKDNERMADFIQRVDEMAECLAALTGEDTPDKEKSLILTRRVHISYRSIIVALQESDRLDDYDHVCSSLINEESIRNKLASEGNSYEEGAFYTNHRGKNNRGRGGRGSNNNNRGQGNQNRNTNNNRQTSNRFDGNCNFCGIYGHKEADCRKKQNSNNNSNNNNNNRGNNYHRGNYRGNRQHHQANYSGHQNQNQDQQQQQQSSNFLFTAISLAATSSSEKDAWILDSGATQHMTSNRNAFITYEKFTTPSRIELGNNSVIYAEGKGSIRLQLFNNTTATLTDILHAPELSKNLFSLAKAFSRGYTIQSHQNTITLYKGDNPTISATSRGNLFYIDGYTTYPNAALSANSTTTGDIQLWHR